MLKNLYTEMFGLEKVVFEKVYDEYRSEVESGQVRMFITTFENINEIPLLEREIERLSSKYKDSNYIIAPKFHILRNNCPPNSNIVTVRIGSLKDTLKPLRDFYKSGVKVGYFNKEYTLTEEGERKLRLYKQLLNRHDIERQEKIKELKQSCLSKLQEISSKSIEDKEIKEKRKKIDKEIKSLAESDFNHYFELIYRNVPTGFIFLKNMEKGEINTFIEEYKKQGRTFIKNEAYRRPNLEEDIKSLPKKYVALYVSNNIDLSALIVESENKQALESLFT